MNTTRRPARPFLGALVAAAVIASAGPAAPPGEGKDTLLPGAKLLHRFPKEVYRIPALVTTEKGARLLLWVDEFDPYPKSRFPGEALPEPVFDVVVWDVAADKELYKVSYPKEGAPHPVADGTRSAATTTLPFGSVAVAPDGKQLAGLTYSYRQVPGKVEHERSAQVRVFDPDNRKWQPATEPEVLKYYAQEMLFAPDGSLLIFKDTSCRVLEPGKSKVRLRFDLERSAASRANPSLSTFRDAVVSPDGSRLAVAVDGTITVYDLANGKKVFQAERAAREAKPGAGQTTMQAALAFAPAPDEPKLLAVETVVGPPRSFVLARVFDLKTKKEASRKVLTERATKPTGPLGLDQSLYTRAYSYFTAKGEPRVIFDGKVIDPAAGKVLHKFDAGGGVLVSRDGKYMVRMIVSKKDEKKIGVELWGLEDDK